MGGRVSRWVSIEIGSGRLQVMRDDQSVLPPSLAVHLLLLPSLTFSRRLSPSRALSHHLLLASLQVLQDNQSRVVVAHEEELAITNDTWHR